EQLRWVGGNRRFGLLINPPGEVEEVEVELDGPLDTATVHVPVLPVEGHDRGAVAPVVAVLVVPGQLFTCAWIVGIRLFGKRPSGLPAVDFAGLGAKADLTQAGAGGFDVVRMQVEGSGLADAQFDPALLDEAQKGRVDDVLELCDIALVDGHTGRQ